MRATTIPHCTERSVPLAGEVVELLVDVRLTWLRQTPTRTATSPVVDVACLNTSGYPSRDGNIDIVARAPKPGDEDHLSRLLLAGGPAWGAYVPQRFELHSGAGETDGRVVHLHEAHHAALN